MQFLKHFRSPTRKPSMSDVQPLSKPLRNDSNDITVVELFQSQGCSSCPPGNANVLTHTEDPRSLIITYHVTYWDHLGWKDTFGNSAFDNRQWEYARALKQKSVFTPQVIVNGRVSGIGNKAEDLESLIAEGTEGTGRALTVDITDGNISIVGPKGVKGFVSMVYYDPKPVDVYISRGENEGKNLPHKNVVRSIIPLGTWHGGSQVFSGLPLLDDESLRMAVLVQASQGGPIIGAAHNGAK